MFETGRLLCRLKCEECKKSNVAKYWRLYALHSVMSERLRGMSLRLDAPVRTWHTVLCRFAVLNDFEAIGYGVPVVPPEDLVVLHDAPVQPKVLPPGHRGAAMRLRNRTASHLARLRGVRGARRKELLFCDEAAEYKISYFA